MKILFLTGWRGAPGGIKPIYLREHGHEVIEPDLDHNDFDASIRVSQQMFDECQPEVVVGLSRGGAVAMNLEVSEARLVLMCPAWKRWGRATTVKKNTVILHSRADNVVRFTFSEELVRNSGLPPGSLVDVGNDHWLSEPAPLAAMLNACGM